ncbi:hypothetical protein DSO57_1021143 [Entomophthora muscae]|uniref:Uncharacterized protein n=1 Tax=Entomophthora muscae TaxID=34485 RepID=A0ACC2RUK6_9FUNG|nr:hypothetical protein DSO57_1021143 [Entomophthora muscae]
MHQKLESIREQSMLLKKLASELISNIDDFSKGYDKLFKEAKRIQKARDKLIQSLEINLKEAKSPEDEGDLSAYEDAIANKFNAVMASLKRPASPCDINTSKVKKAVSSSPQPFSSHEGTLTVLNEILSSIKRDQIPKRNHRPNFKVVPGSHNNSTVAKSLNVVTATEKRCKSFVEAVALVFDHVAPQQCVTRHLVDTQSAQLVTAPSEFDTLEKETLEKVFNEWDGPKGSLETVKDLVSFVLRAWKDPLQYHLSSEIINPNIQSGPTQLRFYRSLFMRHIIHSSDKRDPQLPLFFYLFGLSALDQPAEGESTLLKAAEAQEAAKNMFYSVINKCYASDFLAFWSISMVSLFGRELCPGRLANARWPIERIPLSCATELTVEVQDSVVFSIQYLHNIRKALIQDKHYSC